MKTVSRFEANLLEILQGFFGRAPAGRLLQLVETEIDCPPCLSPSAVELVKDTLQKGVTAYLSRAGGWKHEHFLRDEKIASGRLWERTAPEQLGFAFSRHSLEFLIWITANHPGQSRWKPVSPEEALTIGDRLLLFVAYQSLRGGELTHGLMKHAPFQQHALLWLAYASDFLRLDAPKSWDFSPWLYDQGGCVMESLQAYFAERWCRMEREKQLIADPETMRKFGERQHGIGTALFDAAEKAGRWDLCRFFLHAMRRMIPMQLPESKLNVEHLRLTERWEVYQSAAASFQLMNRMASWNRQARSIGYYDEGYSASQLWKSNWEELDGDRLCAESETHLQNMQPAKSDATQQQSSEATTNT